jgi:hypothetical protein
MVAAATRTQLNLPRPVRVRIGAGGVPVQVDGRSIELVRESWLVEDRWWTAQPLRRRYWELVSTSGRNMVVFHDLGAGPSFERDAGVPPEDAGHERVGCWFVQRS